MPHILVVDDNEMNRDMLGRRLQKQGYDISYAENGAQALDSLKAAAMDLVLLDIQMPVMNGHETLAAMKADPSMKDVPVIVISAQNELEGVVSCIEMGAEDYLNKPFNPVILKARIHASLEKKRLSDESKRYKAQIEEHNQLLELRVIEQVLQITVAQRGAIFAMSKLAESKDPETGAHLERMREYCRQLASRLQSKKLFQDQVTSTFIDNIYAASPLHDIGKVGVPDNVLLKPGKLDADEWVLMKTHSTIGAETLRAVDRQHPGNSFLVMGIDIAENHHEKWDGSGYPKGLAGEAIPLSARILALGDVYDALTSKRCYKEPFSHEKSRGIIVDSRGTHFDSVIVDAFLDIEDEFIRVRNEFQDQE